MAIIKGDGLSRIITGRVIKDAESSTFGEKKYPKAKFTVAVSEDKNDKHGLLSCEAVFELAKACSVLRKGDRVLVSGTLSPWEGKDGEKRYSLNVDFCTKALTADASPIAPELEGFENIESDELPF